MKPKTSIVLAALLAAFVTGCNDSAGVSNPNIRHYQQSTINNANPRVRLVLGSEKLVGKIALVDARLGTAGALPRVEVSAQNLTDHRYTLEYMYTWEDQQGFGINDNPVWRRFVLGPREIKSLRSVGKSPDAYSVTLTVRLPDDIFIHQEQTPDKR